MAQQFDKVAKGAGRASRRGRESVTIGDVARHAGVSPMTVSRVINGGVNVREATRDQVNASIAALHYAPSAAARSLATADETRVGLLYSNPSMSYLGEFLIGGLDQASRSNVQLVVERCDLEEQEVETVRRMLRQGIDGLILPPPLCDSAEIRAVLLEAGVPAVTVASGRPDIGLAAVSIDDHQAARRMTEHLIALGHDRIGFVTGHPNQTASLRRLDGYRDALAGRGIALDEGLIEQGYFTYRSGLDAAERLLALETPPTAIFASNDDMAAAIVATAHRHGLDVPGDLTVVGFDDTPLATTIWPELTTIHQPIAAMSRKAMELLVRAIRERRGGEGGDPVHQTLDFTLVRRQSDAAPRRRPKARRH
ncbi:LacI family DNA-binding transcriptional regulator [Sphingomonas naphthae]|uniref:LacI family DNA-binding transcriptional regulator n=1 Tax=Sphingomonas naphthae TaxID=1813468 RepID=A0ABY7TJG7_9SPHN|nr:LacI family DNA-binding transcriptional regulator [Sphingomonas naphthae]WCT73095.1 LacI family DNA-binding transcriptional regulator [Sphingomonas naphthae]